MARRKAESQMPIRPDLPFDDSSLPIRQDPQAQADASKGELEALQRQFEELRGELERQRAANTALMSQPLGQQPPQVPQFDTRGLPDPLSAPADYAVAVAQRTQAVEDGKRQVEQWQQNQQQQYVARLDALWDQFSQAHPDYAVNPNHVKYAAKEVVEQASARGLDVNKYMFLHADQFMADVMKEMDNTFGVEVNDVGTYEDGPLARDEYDDEGSSAGLVIGSSPGSRPVPREENQRMPSMFDDIREWQQKTGFSR